MGVWYGIHVECIGQVPPLARCQQKTVIAQVIVGVGDQQVAQHGVGKQLWILRGSSAHVYDASAPKNFFIVECQKLV